MKKLLFGFFVSLTVSGFVNADNWSTDYEAAREKAKAQNKPVLLLFTGSDWCGWCIKLEKEVFSKRDFEKYAREKLLSVMADFPRRKRIPAKVKKQNEELRNKYQIRGFPTVLLLNPFDETVIARTGYQAGGAEKYIEHLEKLTTAFHEKHGPPAEPSEPIENPYEQSRVWTDSSGRKLTGRLISFDGDKVTIQTLTGNHVTATLDALSEEDQNLLAKLPDEE